MSSARHRAVPPRRAHRALASTGPSRVASRGGVAFRRTVISSSAVVAVAGLSLSMVVPANAAAAHHEVPAPRTVSSRIHAPKAQSYAVPSTVQVSPDASRDDYTATDPAVLAAHDAAVAAAGQTVLVRKSRAIVAILAAEVTTVGQDPAGATTTTTTGTVSDVVDAATLHAASGTADEIVASAIQYVGKVPYVHNGADPATGFDCSGLVMYVYAQFGIAVPHDVDGIAALGSPIAAKDLQPGDLVVYPHQHIGIYIGDGYMVDAPDVGRDVEVQKVWGAPTFVHIDKA